MNLQHPVLKGRNRPASDLPRAWPRVLLATVVAIIVTYAEFGLKLKTPSVGNTPFTILGVAISIFLGFRNNSAYGRFWEARTLWGNLINSSRSFARQTITLVASPEHGVRAFKEDVVMATIAYAHALRHHLHSSDPFLDIHGLMLREEVEWLRTQQNVPVAILHLIGRRLGWARERGWIDMAATLQLEGSLTDLTNAQGGCERIKNTPIPETYALLSGTIVTFFCLFLPFGIIDTAKILTPLVVFLVAYSFFGLDALGEEVTEPFGDDPHDLPLEKYTETIELNLRQILEDRELPVFEVQEDV